VNNAVKGGSDISKENGEGRNSGDKGEESESVPSDGAIGDISVRIVNADCNSKTAWYVRLDLCSGVEKSGLQAVSKDRNQGKNDRLFQEANPNLLTS